MSVLAPLLTRVARARRAVRARAWEARMRVRLAAAGCDLEVVMAPGAGFASWPDVVPTRQHTGSEIPGRRGKLRIEVGAGSDLGRLTTIEIVPSADSRLVLGDGVVLGTAVRLMLFGGEIRVGAWSRLRDGVSLKSSGNLDTGEHTILQSHCMLHCARELVVEDRVTFGERVSVLDSDHQPDGSDVYTQDQPLAVDPVRIGNNAWIGANVVILRGARVGRNAVIAAGSVVRGGDYPDGWLIAGAPASAKRALAPPQ